VFRLYVVMPLMVELINASCEIYRYLSLLMILLLNDIIKTKHCSAIRETLKCLLYDIIIGLSRILYLWASENVPSLWQGQVYGPVCLLKFTSYLILELCTKEIKDISVPGHFP